MSRKADTQIADILADSGADLDELRRLRSRIRELHHQVQEDDEADAIEDAMSKAFDVVDILLGEGILKTRHRSAEGSDPARLLAIVQANVDYLQAALRAFSR